MRLERRFSVHSTKGISPQQPKWIQHCSDFILTLRDLKVSSWVASWAFHPNRNWRLKLAAHQNSAPRLRRAKKVSSDLSTHLKSVQPRPKCNTHPNLLSWWVSKCPIIVFRPPNSRYWDLLPSKRKFVCSGLPRFLLTDNLDRNNVFSFDPPSCPREEHSPKVLLGPSPTTYAAGFDLPYPQIVSPPKTKVEIS